MTLTKREIEVLQAFMKAGHRFDDHYLNKYGFSKALIGRLIKKGVVDKEWFIADGETFYITFEGRAALAALEAENTGLEMKGGG